MRGRKPKPLETQIAEGDPRKKGRRKLQEALSAIPKASRGLPPCPRHLKGRARAAWTSWTAELETMQLDRRPDAQMLEGACVNYARAVKADLQLEREGLTVEESVIGEDGDKVILRTRTHPLVTVSNQAWRQVRSFCSEFGFSPVSRMRVHTEKPDTGEDELARLLAQPRQRPAATVQ